MAKMTLTIPKASAVDSSGKKLDTGLSMTTGAEAAAGRSILKAEYYAKEKKATSWGDIAVRRVPQADLQPKLY